jgi:hypothetical protein
MEMEQSTFCVADKKKSSDNLGVFKIAMKIYTLIYIV